MKTKLFLTITTLTLATFALVGCKPAPSAAPAEKKSEAKIETTPEPLKKTKKVETIDDLADFFPKQLCAVRVSMLGGGTHHDFDRWFNVSDSVTFSYASTEPVNYTTNLTYFHEGMKDHDVLYFCNNSPMTNAELNKAIFEFADKGGGFLLVHPATWYNWKDWPEWNRVLVGGGTRKHDKYGPIDVTIEKRDHPIMYNIPKTFRVDDELYHFEKDPGAEIEVLATATNPETGNKFPVIWITKHPKARIINITLGHDGSTHDNIAFRVMLQNCMMWVGQADKVLAEQKALVEDPKQASAK